MDDADLVQRATLAVSVKAELTRRVEARVDSILASLINKHRMTAGVTGDEAKAAVAAISEMRLLLGAVDSDLRQGEQARQRLMAPSREDSAERTR